MCLLVFGFYWGLSFTGLKGATPLVGAHSLDARASDAALSIRWRKVYCHTLTGLHIQCWCGLSKSTDLEILKVVQSKLSLSEQADKRLFHSSGC